MICQEKELLNPGFSPYFAKQPVIPQEILRFNAFNPCVIPPAKSITVQRRDACVPLF